jgi:hypothetical protein
MSNQLKKLDLRIWNKKVKKWLKSDNSIKKGIYLIHFKPTNMMYEVRNLSKQPFKKHVIEKDEIVLKSGKFTAGIKNRVFGSSGYAKYWKYEYEVQGRERTLSDCFEKSTTIYLIADLSNYNENEYIELVEVYTKLILKRSGVEKQEKANSEYFKFTKNINGLLNDINKIRDKVEEFVNNNS